MTSGADWLKALAPTLVTAIGGPLAGIAYDLVGKALGTSADEAKSILTSGNVTQEQLAAIKVAEADAKRLEQEQAFKFADLAVKDRDSARAREMALQDSTNKVLAYTIVGSFIALIGATLLGWAKVDSALAGTLVGYLSAKAEQVLAYYFGSSVSSRNKTELLAKAPAIKEN